MCVCAPLACLSSCILWPQESRHWNYRWLLAVMWVLGIKPEPLKWSKESLLKMSFICSAGCCGVNMNSSMGPSDCPCVLVRRMQRKDFSSDCRELGLENWANQQQVTKKKKKKKKERTKLLSALKLTDSSSEMEGGSTDSLFRSWSSGKPEHRKSLPCGEHHFLVGPSGTWNL